MTFTPNPPTEPGAYWWKHDDSCPAYLVNVKVERGVLFSWYDSEERLHAIEDEFCGLWSSRLIPLDALSELKKELKKLSEDNLSNAASALNEFNRQIPLIDKIEALTNALANLVSAIDNSAGHYNKQVDRALQEARALLNYPTTQNEHSH